MYILTNFLLIPALGGRYHYYFFIHQQGNRGSEKLNNMFKVSCIWSVGSLIQIQMV